MKAFLLAALLVLPLAAAAQSLELRGYGGVMMNSGIRNAPTASDGSKPNAILGLRASYRSKRLDFGIAVSYRRYSFQKTIIDRGSFNPLTGYSGPETRRRVLMTEPAVAFAPVINYHFGGGRLDWYAGVSPAYIRYTVGSIASGHFSLTDGGQGFSAEVQVGCNYAVRPGMSVFAELHGGLVGIQYYLAKNSRFYNAGLNAGAQFRVWQARVKAATVK